MINALVQLLITNIVFEVAIVTSKHIHYFDTHTETYSINNIIDEAINNFIEHSN